MNAARVSIIFLLGSALVCSVGCAPAQSNYALPEQSRAHYEEQIPSFVKEARNRTGVNPGGKLALNGQVLLAPVVYHWQPESSSAHTLPPLWEMSDHERSVQTLATETESRILRGLQARGYDSVTPEGLKKSGVNAGEIGETPPADGAGRAPTNARLSGYPYVSNKLKQWSIQDFEKIRSSVPSITSIIFTEIYSVWHYKSLTRLNGEATVNYTVETVPSVKVCTGTPMKCTEARFDEKNALKSILPVPAKTPVNEAVQKSNNDFSINLAGKYNSDVVLSVIDNIATR